MFKKLKLGYDWCQRNQHNQTGIEELYKRTEQIFQELESLGVSRTFSEALFVFGAFSNHEVLHGQKH
ncbi:hypothetical protein HYS92_00125 [Candidatus Daviesbacteria bacterium]|nr:hypothetical protein [Candidatus Daviesbacteria bacterium]